MFMDASEGVAGPRSVRVSRSSEAQAAPGAAPEGVKAQRFRLKIPGAHLLLSAATVRSRRLRSGAEKR